MIFTVNDSVPRLTWSSVPSRRVEFCGPPSCDSLPGVSPPVGTGPSRFSLYVLCPWWGEFGVSQVGWNRDPRQEAAAAAEPRVCWWAPRKGVFRLLTSRRDLVSLSAERLSGAAALSGWPWWWLTHASQAQVLVPRVSELPWQPSAPLTFFLVGHLLASLCGETDKCVTVLQLGGQVELAFFFRARCLSVVTSAHGCLNKDRK